MNNKCRKPKTGWVPASKFMQMHLKPKATAFAAIIAEKNAELFKYTEAHGYNPNGTYILKITMDSAVCPHCEVKLLPADIAHRRCLTCHHFLAFPVESAADILKVRIEAGLYSYDLDVVKKPPKSIYKAYYDGGGGKLQFVLRTYKGTLDA